MYVYVRSKESGFPNTFIHFVCSFCSFKTLGKSNVIGIIRILLLALVKREERMKDLHVHMPNVYVCMCVFIHTATYANSIQHNLTVPYYCIFCRYPLVRLKTVRICVCVCCWFSWTLPADLGALFQLEESDRCTLFRHVSPLQFICLLCCIVASIFAGHCGLGKLDFK